MNSEFSSVDWTRLCDALKAKNLIEMRMTDHEYRKDSRNITHINGKKLDFEVPVDSLRWAKENGDTRIAQQIILLSKQ